MIKPALRVAAVFALVATVWIVSSDWVLHRIIESPELEASLQTVKGWVFVLITSLLIYVLVGRLYRQLQAEMQLRKDHEQAIQQQTHYDQLTNLPNRLLTLDRMEQAIHSAAQHQSHAALLLVDLDHFKDVNETQGHAVGDQLLRAVAQRLSLRLRHLDTLGRYGADEFLVVVRDLASPTDCEQTAAEIMDAMSSPFMLAERPVMVTCSIGIAVFPADGQDAPTLLRNADAAMHQGKLKTRNNFYFYTPELNKVAQERFNIEQQLRGALGRREFELHYQPIFDADSRELKGAEVLLRWHNPELGRVFPDRFIPLAEQLGLIQDIGRWVLQEACLTLVNWQHRYRRRLTLSVNVSPIQVAEGCILPDVRAALENSGLPAEQLVVEVTEGLLLLDTDVVNRTLTDLDNLGVSLSLDDFGTGYSSLRYLQQFPFDEVKIDRSFVSELSANSASYSMIKAVTALTRELCLSTVAEGVEEEQQVRLLSELGINLLQGYLLGRPQPPNEFETQFLLPLRREEPLSHESRGR